MSTGAAGRFANVSAVSGLDFPDDGRAVALADWDHDGDLDVWISNRNAPRLRLMRNDTPTENHFVSLRLVGNGTTTNRDAIGARVEVVLKMRHPEGTRELGTRNSEDHSPLRAPNSALIKTLRAGEGFLSQSSKWLHFGLGTAQAIEMVTVRWPGGQTEQFSNVQVDGRYRLVQGSGEPRLVDSTPRETILQPSTLEITPTSSVARIPLVVLLTLPEMDYLGFDGQRRRLPARSGSPLLLTMWASWCSPCVAELNEFARRQNEIRDKGIQIVALSVNGLGSDSSTSAEAARLVSQLQFPYESGQATLQLLNYFQRTHDNLVVTSRPLPLPASFLIDQQGRLAVIYKGPVSVDDLLQDVAHSEGSRVERFERSAAPLVGRSIIHPRVEQTRISRAVALRRGLGSSLQQSGRLDEAARQFTEILELTPESAEVHNDLGMVLQQQGKLRKAEKHLRHAIRVRPDFAQAHNNLGIVLQRTGELSEAEEHLRRALAITPDYAEGHNNLGNALQRQNKLAEAEDHYRQALLLQPQLANTHANLGNVLTKLGDLSGAADHYREALRIKPNFEAVRRKLERLRPTIESKIED